MGYCALCVCLCARAHACAGTGGESSVVESLGKARALVQGHLRTRWVALQKSVNLLASPYLFSG